MSATHERAAPKERRGRLFEDFEVGDVFRSRPGRAVTETDDTRSTNLTLNANGEVVIEYLRTFMVPRRDAPESVSAFPSIDAEWGGA